ncbi:hypothetical protein [Devosia sp.]|uniref:hypothetical protein n=1 Tax=Devosia sp. TaxID=1871048 RepID=UPI0035B4F564
MIAGLLYVIGLIAALVTVAMVGYSAPPLVQAVMTALDGPNANLFVALGDAARALSWALGPFVGGIVLMGLGRIIMLLGAINRALRGTA